ncbi:MAG: hypothetical protein J0L62_07420 [Bacteroidetes bacterium]|nr:hypothetical protein [Bacteroidota bacterium]
MSSILVPDSVRQLSEDKQSEWIQEKLPELKKKTEKLILRQLLISVGGFSALVVILEILLGIIGRFDFAVRMTLYVILMIWWQFTPYTRKRNLEIRENRKMIRELELYQVFLAARKMKKSIKEPKI